MLRTGEVRVPETALGAASPEVIFYVTRAMTGDLGGTPT